MTALPFPYGQIIFRLNTDFVFSLCSIVKLIVILLRLLLCLLWASLPEIHSFIDCVGLLTDVKLIVMLL